MSIKITGMNSGLDTDAIVRELVSAASTRIIRITGSRQALLQLTG